MNSLPTYQIRIAIILIAAFLFVPFLGGVHLFDWDEINFAEAAREMIVSGNYITVQINFQAFWEKPPLFIYFQVLMMKLFGINEFAARLPNAICGIITLLTLFNIGLRLKDKKFALLWVLAYCGSILPFLYFKSGIIDPWFNLFIFLGIYYLLAYARQKGGYEVRQVVFAAFFAGLAVLTKGPVGFLLIALTSFVYLIYTRFKIKTRFTDILIYFLVLAFVGGFWFLIQIINGQMDTVLAFIEYQIRLFQTEDASHGGFFGYHFVVLLFGVFPTSVLSIRSFRKYDFEEREVQHFKTWMIILFWVVLILFSIVKTKIVHYSSLAYFPISFLAALFIYQAKQGEIEWRRWQSILIVSIASLISIPFLMLPFVDKIKANLNLEDIIKDPFALGNLQANASWTGFEVLIGLGFLAGMTWTSLFISNSKILKKGVSLWLFTILFTYSTLIFIVPKIEVYTQRANIEFISNLAGEDVYIKTMYFKSYAPFFYGKSQIPENQKFYDTDWLLNGEIDKPVYFISKVQHKDLREINSEIELIGEKNGFRFYKRKTPKKM